MLEWWSEHSYGKHIYIGHGIYRAEEKNSRAWKKPDELPNQIKLLRQYPNIQGAYTLAAVHLIKTPMAGMTACRITIIEYLRPYQ